MVSLLEGSERRESYTVTVMVFEGVPWCFVVEVGVGPTIVTVPETVQVTVTVAAEAEEALA